MAREFRFDGVTYSDSSPAMVIAEIGHNHAHDLDKLTAMVRAAKDAGASAVKFQTRHPKEVYQASSERGAYFYESDNPQWLNRIYGVHRENLELTRDEWVAVRDFCKSLGITMFSTPFDFKSLELLEWLGVPGYKVASGDATNIPLITEIARTGKPTIISTGGCSIKDVDRLYDAFTKIHPNLAILQCTCVYPCPPDALNLRVIESYRSRYNCVTGLSTHNTSWYPSIAAYALGGRIFEHHFTVDRTWQGTDNNFSLTPEMLKQFVVALKEAHLAMGKYEKFCQPIEEAPTKERRKKLVWARNVLDGQVIKREDIKIQCPAFDGIPPYHIDAIVGQLTAYTTGAGETIRWQDLLVVVNNSEFFRAVRSA